MDRDEDPVIRSDALERRILAIPEDQVFTKPVVVVGFLVIMMAITLGFTIMFVELRDITAQTNEAVRRQIPALEQQIADQEEVIGQAVDAVVMLQRLLREAGIEPPEVVLRPLDDEDGG